ncbi:MAG: SAM-dependent methyltransferase [Anaerolineaceae bacterium]|nr:SAM-dependent methyltransferase [Anaerolineaceae bacterium]
MNLDDIEFLTSDAGSRLLDDLAAEDVAERNTLSLLTRLRKNHSPQQAGAALTLAQLRRKAEAKFGANARRMYFTAAALEQASDPLVRRYRAQMVAGLQVVDAGCGIGADALAMAQAGGDVLGLDIDPVRVALARLNAAALDVSARFEVADVTQGLPNADMVFFDPARRDADGRRAFHVEHYQPPLSVIREWQAPRIVVKLSPGVDVDQLAPYGGSVEFVSVAGDLKEAILWLGFDRPRMQATLLAGEAVHQWPMPQIMPQVPLAEPRGWLVEPDPALLRAGLVEAVAAELGGAMLDETIAYMTTTTQPQSPWVRAWRIIDWMPFHLKRLRAYLRARHIGQVTVKKRGVAITPEELTSKLRLKGGRDSCTIVLTRYQAQPIAIVCEDFVP